MSDLSPLSGVKRKLDFGAVRAAFGPLADIGLSLNDRYLRPPLALTVC